MGTPGRPHRVRRPAARLAGLGSHREMDSLGEEHSMGDIPGGCDGSTVPTSAGGNRLSWRDVPERVRSEIEIALGGRVVHSHSQAGGFSPGLASRVITEYEDRFFVKAIRAECTPLGPDIYRAELRVASKLPQSVPTPTLFHAYDDTEWVGFVFEDVEGSPPNEQWEPDDLELVLNALTDLSQNLTPSPIELATIQEVRASDFSGWRSLEDQGRLQSAIVRDLRHAVTIQVVGEGVGVQGFSVTARWMASKALRPFLRAVET